MIKSIKELKALPAEIRAAIKENSDKVKFALNKGKALQGLGLVPDKAAKEKKVQSFDEVVRKYNKGITESQIQAWVWYRRRLGIPMTGWEKFYIKTGSVKSDLLVAKNATTLKDNHFRDIRTVPKGAVLGFATKKTHEYDGIVFQIIRSPDNELLYVPKKDLQETKTGVSADEKELTRLVKAGALYYSDGDLLPEPIYTFGNIYSKLDKLKRDQSVIEQNYGEDVYLRHWEKLEERKPKPLTVTNDNEGERPYLTPYAEFSKTFTIDMLRPSCGVVIEKVESLTDAFILWLDTLSREDFKESSAYNIDVYYVQGRFPTPTVLKSFVEERMAEMKKAGAKDSFTDKEEAAISKEVSTDLVASAKNEGEKLYSRFLHEALTVEHQNKLDDKWNRQFNGEAEINYSHIPMGCELSATWNGFPWEMKPVQREGVGFMEAVESGILAFDVGVGKTLTAIVEAAQALHDGKCKRVLLSVPDGVYKKWKAELFGQFDKKGNQISTGILSGTDITLNEWGNLGAKWLPKVDINNVPEKSITLVNYNGLVNCGFSYEVATEFIEELRLILLQQEGISNRDKVKAGEKIAATIGNALEKNIAQIDKVGFDYLVIDEAHNFKNIFAHVKKKGNDKKRRFSSVSGSVTERGVKAFLIANYIQRRYGKNIMLLSATPFTNHPIEVYSMLSLVGYDSMKRRNILNLNEFFELHVREVMENVVTIKETIEPRAVVRSFNNRMLLQSLIYNHIIYRTADGEKRPKKINLPRLNTVNADGRITRLKAKDQTLTYLKMTDWQRQLQNQLVRDIEDAIKARSGGRMFSAMSRSLDNAFSPFLAEKEHPVDCYEFVAESPKINYVLECIRSVKDHHDKKGELCSGQIIYINRGKDYFQYIKEWLEKELGFKRKISYKEFQKEQGVPESEMLDIRSSFDEVEIIEGGASVDQKDNIKEAFNAGLVKVIIGTSTISEGMDFQKRGTCIYNCYPEYNPTQIRQLEGRIWRFGNPYKNVRIVLPLVQDSMDVFVFQKLDEKTSRINDIWYRSDRGNVLDLEALDPEEVKYALITKLDELVRVIVEKERKEVERKIGLTAGNIPVLKGYKRDITDYDNRRERLMKQLYRFKDNMELNGYITTPPTEEMYKVMDKERRELIKRDLELYAAMKEFEAKGEAVSDSEIAAFVRRIRARFDYFDGWTYDYYKQIRDKVLVTEKIFSSKGFTRNDDIDKIIETFETEVKQLREQLTFILSEDHHKEVLREVERKKSALAIEGKTIKERVEEFAALNWMLDEKEVKAPKEAPKKDLKLLKLKAKAKKKKLELLKLKLTLQKQAA